MDARATEATDLMTVFADRTGLTSRGPQQRYLWTDAFAVCNFLALGREDLARVTIDAVHHTLGRSRDDNRWLDGADEEHPTRGGLRIGKKLPDRGPTEPVSERLEWERDGQYFHYLTKWMHALDVMARHTGDQRYHRWALELAVVAHRRFTYDARGGKRMYWKLSVDLSRPVVTSMGHHDPLDGFVTAVQLDAPPEIITDYVSMIDPHGFATPDPLGIGGLLVDAYRVHQLLAEQAWLRDLSLLEPLLEGALIGLSQIRIAGAAEQRLGFRELGLAIGLAAVERIPVATSAFARALPMRTEIEELWRDPVQRGSGGWREHADINDVMLATALVPDGFLELPRRDAREDQPVAP